MANTIKPKRSNTASKVPNTSELISGELGVNMADKKIYINNGTSIVQVGAGVLSALGDVTITSPTNGQSLSYNGTAWVNSTGGGSGTVTSVGITPLTGVTVSNSPITTSGNISVGLSTKLTAIENLSGSGFFTQNGSGAIAGRTIQAGTGISVAHGNGASQDPTISNSGVLGVTATSPVASSGGQNPVISMPQASGSANGWLSSTDWTTFNNKQAALGFTPYNATNPSNYIALASAITGYTVGTNTALAATDTLLAGLGKIQGQINARGTGNGTVTSVGGTGGYGGLTLSGTVTTSGNITLGGTPTGTWPVSVSGNAATATLATNATSAYAIDNIAFTNSDATAQIANPDNLTTNGMGYTGGVSLFGQTDGALYGQAYSTAWIHQIFGDYRTGQLAVRGKQNNTWQAWRTILDSSNYTSYAPSLTGSGASGTWGINVTGSSASCTGNAATATNATTAGRIVSTVRNYSYEWIEMPNHSGLYSPLNGAHFYPNNGSYGAWRLDGSRNGWKGIEFDGQQTLMMNDGAVGVHRNIGGGWRYYVEGNNFYSPGLVQAYWSDRRLKENLIPIRNESLDILSKLTTYRFNWNSKVKELELDIEVGKEEIGLIAQEVQAILPDAVAINKSLNRINEDGTQQDYDYLTINYDKITPLLVEGVNLLRKEIEELKIEIAKLKGQK
jgi:hypothetical protein